MVVDSRLRQTGRTYRRRACLNKKCRHRWTTVELSEADYKTMRDYWLSAKNTFAAINKAIKGAKVVLK